MQASGFNKFVCMISLCTIFLKFVRIPWPDVHIMNNLEECFYNVLTNFILLHKKTRLLKLDWVSRSSCQDVLYKKGVRRNFIKSRKTSVPESLFNEVADLRPATLLKKKRLKHRCFPVNFAKFLRTPFLTEQLQWLLLNISSWFQWRLLRKISFKELGSLIKQG